MIRALFITVLITFVLLPIGNTGTAQAEMQLPQYLSPVPGSNHNPAGTTIAFSTGERFDAYALKELSITVTGSVSGPHSGKVVLARDEMTVIFQPDQPFIPGEQVKVLIRSGGTASGISYSFSIQEPARAIASTAVLESVVDSGELVAQAAPTVMNTAAGTYKTAPADLPNIHATTPAGDVGDGYLFLSNFRPSAFMGESNPGAYLLILDNNGEPVYYQPVPETTLAADFKVLSNGLLAYWQDSEIYLLDNQYKLVRKLVAGNGYNAIDLHDVIVLPNGNYIYLIYAGSVMDMTEHGGPADAYVIDIVIQEQDADGNIVFQWVGLDPGHYELTDSNRSLTTQQVDYVHANAIELDDDGNLLLSSRHLDEITKIGRETRPGEIIWRLGGKRNQFTFLNAEGDPAENEDEEKALRFFMQHDIRNLPDGAIGDISIYDNHNNAVSGDTIGSRALVYDLDEENKIARLVWEYGNTPDVYANFMGNAQYLPNNNFVIGWGGVSSPVVTEVKQDGTKVFELGFDDGPMTYRAYRFPWEGNPTWAPALVIEPAGDSIQLYMSWNGATETARYEVYGVQGASRTLITEVDKTGFETSVELSGEDAGYCLYQILPVNDAGESAIFSNVVLSPDCEALYMPIISASSP